MSIGISENFKQSLMFTKENLVGKILNWVILFVIALLSSTYLTTLLPDLSLLWSVLTIIGLITMYGLLVRIYAGGEVTFANFGTLIKKGIGYLVASLVYSLPALILIVISTGILMTGSGTGAVAAGLAVGIILLMLSLILALLASFFIIPAAVNYAHSTGLGGAFRISEILARIENAGWGKFIGSYLIFLVIGIILAGLMCIPFVGGILYALAYSFLIVLQAKYYANLLS